jgi:hypothetical protein
MKILNRKGDTDPVTEAIATVGPHGERVMLTPFQPVHTASDDVEGFGVGQNQAAPPEGRLKINIPFIGRSVVIK